MIRQTAFKVWISDLVNGRFEKNLGEFEPNFVVIKDLNVSRVNLIGTAVFKSENPENYASLTLDDGSAGIRVKAWREDTSLISDVNVGDIINIIGRVRNFNDEIYLTPEVIKKVDANWELVRKLELLKKYGVPKEEAKEEKVEEEKEEAVVEEVVIEETSKQRVLDIIEKLDSEEGVDIDKVIETSGLGQEEVDSVIQDLLKVGEVYENKKGKVRLVS